MMEMTKEEQAKIKRILTTSFDSTQLDVLTSDIVSVLRKELKLSYEAAQAMMVAAAQHSLIAPGNTTKAAWHIVRGEWETI